MAKAPQPAPQTPAVTIISRKEGFRRCGIAHTTAPATYEAGRFTDAELEALEAEPMLIVTEAPAAEPAPAAS